MPPPGSPTPGPSTARGPKGAPVVGRVVEFKTLQPLPGRVVAIGARRAVTDAAGGFTIDDVPETYDLAVVEPQGQAASVYRGLHRRDPVLPHEIVFPQAGVRVANVVASLVGGGPAQPGDLISVVFVAASGTLFEREPFARPCGPTYPDCQPLRLVWQGPETITGELVALRVPGAAARAAGAPVLLGHETITLRSRSVTSAPPPADERTCAQQAPAAAPPQEPPSRMAVQLAPVPLRHVAVEFDVGFVQAPGVVYEWPGRRGRASVPWPRDADKRLAPGPARLEADLPDLSGIGARLCLAESTPSAQVETCQVPSGDAAKLRLLAPFSAWFPPGTPSWERAPLMARDTQVSWQRAAGVGYGLLKFSPPEPPSGYPIVDVYTDGTSAGWPDLAALGVPFPADFVRYRVTLAGFGEFATLDDAVSPRGLAAAEPGDRASTWGHPEGAAYMPSVTLTPTGAAPAEPACEVPTLDCGPPPDCGCGPAGRGCWCGRCNDVRHGPWDVRQVNRILALRPGLAATLGTRCVRDCAGLRAFREAFQRTRPDGLDEPLLPEVDPEEHLLKQLHRVGPNQQPPHP